MGPEGWVSLFGPFGAFLAFLVYQGYQSRMANGKASKESGSDFNHQILKVLQEISRTSVEIGRSQAVQSQILYNQGKTLERIERKVEGK